MKLSIEKFKKYVDDEFSIDQLEALADVVNDRLITLKTAIDKVNHKRVKGFMKNLKEALKQLQEEKPGLWANIRAKRARGEKPSHKNSNAHKDAVKAGKKINKNK